jgi:hypothetical protein
MKYLALIFSDSSVWQTFSEEERTQAYAEYTSFGEEARKAGVIVGGDELAPTRSATTVRVRDGQQLVTDGPYAETKEGLGGYYVLDCESMDQAIDWAARIPGARYGAVEVRQVHVEEEDGTTESVVEREEVAS